MQNTRSTITTDSDRQQFAELQKLITHYRMARDVIIKDVDNNNYTKANELFPNLAQMKRYVYCFRQRTKIRYGYGKVNYDNSQSSYNSARVKIIIVTALGLFYCYYTRFNNIYFNFKTDKEGFSCC